ncbi:YdcF family protein [Dokdonella sp. MW10]|uniref:YdcF family protein n=1 Tax=Dokdonella sp. MW10 TaxID=2992926 RepID=UPI003F7F44BE
MLSWLVSPLRLGVLAALVAVLLWRWLPRSLRVVAGLAVFACLVLTTPWAANHLVRWQEARASSPEDCIAPLPQTIVLLGGGVTTRPHDAGDVKALSPASLRRSLAAAERYGLEPSPIVVSGGPSPYAGSDVTESALMATLLERLGVPREAIREEARSRTTWQNARFTAELDPAVPRRIWLVTSELHMARAEFSFREAGFDVCAWPAERLQATGGRFRYLLPATSALAKTDAALHEILGEFAYRRGWLRDGARAPESQTGED